MTAVPTSPGRQSSSLWHYAVLLAGLLAVCIVAVTQLPPLHETAGVLLEGVSRNRLLYGQLMSVPAASVAAAAPALSLQRRTDAEGHLSKVSIRCKLAAECICGNCVRTSGSCGPKPQPPQPRSR
jgi:hypothetical protein